MTKRTRKTPRQIWDTFSLKDKRQCAANDYRCLRIGIYGGNMSIEERLLQVATVINEIDDPKVPRNIRRQAKETCEQWLLNKGKKLDVRIAMSQSKLEELYEDPNIPPEFGTLILMINTELEKLLRESF